MKLLTSSKDHNKEQIKKVIQLYEQRKIPRRDTAELLIYKLQSKGKTKNKDALKRLDEYDKKEPVRGALKRSEEENIRVRIIGKRKAEAVEKIKQKFREFKEPRIQYKNLDRPLSYVEFNIDHLKTSEHDFLVYMSKIKSKVISEINKLLLIKNNIKVGLGFDATWIKKKIKDPFKDEVEHEDLEDRKPLDAKHITIYNKDTVDKALNTMIQELEQKIEAIKLKDTGWSIKRIHVVYLKSFTENPVRGSSYIPTPEKYSNAKCGLINIQNDDQECFKWCMKYHQSEKKEKSHRVTALKKVNDKYIYENVHFPAALQDIEQF